MKNRDKLVNHVGFLHQDELVEAFGEEILITSSHSQKSGSSNLKKSGFNSTPRKDKKVTIVEEQQVMCMGSPEYNLQGKPMSGK